MIYKLLLFFSVQQITQLISMYTIEQRARKKKESYIEIVFFCAFLCFFLSQSSNLNCENKMNNNRYYENEQHRVCFCD